LRRPRGDGVERTNTKGMIAVSLVAAALVFAADPTPAPVPSPVPVTSVSVTSLLGTAVPDLPEIGRVRATSPSCAVLRDLIIPSFAAAKRSDDQFSVLSTAGPAYASAAADRDISEQDVATEQRYGSDAGRQRSHMDMSLSGQLREIQIMDAALSDPRFAASADDPKILAEQQQLRDLRDAHMARASVLNEFVLRTQLADMKQLPSSSGLGPGGIRGRQTISRPPERPHAPLDYLPILNGDPMHDALAMHNWYRSLSSVVHAREYLAANTFLDIAKECK
jgi:hypothetical protein